MTSLNSKKTTSLKQKILKLFLGLVTLLALVFIGEIWFDILDSALFVKVLGTIIVISFLLIAFMIIFDGIDEDKKMKDDNYIN